VIYSSYPSQEKETCMPHLTRLRKHLKEKKRKLKVYISSYKRGGKNTLLDDMSVS
jgi:hypothetical protein